MYDEIIAGLLKRIVALEAAYERTRRRETVAIRSVDGGVYPTGQHGQLLVDFSTGQIFYWDDVGESWELTNS